MASDAPGTRYQVAEVRQSEESNTKTGIDSSPQCELLPPFSPRLVHPLDGLSLVESDNLLTKHIAKLASDEETKEVLRFRGIPKRSGGYQDLTIEQKQALMPLMRRAYNPSMAQIRLAKKILGHVRESLLLRNPEDPRYQKFFYSQGNVLRNGGRLQAMPAYLRSLQGTGFILAGPTGMGKTAFIEQLRLLLGMETITLRSNVPNAPAEMQFLPMLVIQWPDCGTSEGFFENFRSTLIGAFGTASTSIDALSNLRGRNRANAAIAISILSNLGLLVIDGGRTNSLRADTRDIINFISTFQESSGIPVLVSCTYPVLQFITRSGGRGTALASAHVEYFDRLPLDGLWESYCVFYWKLGLFHGEKPIPMPDFLPLLMWKASRGNMRALCQAFIALHHALLEQPKLLETGQLTEEVIARLLAIRLRQFTEPHKVLDTFQVATQRGEELESTDLWTYGDYLPFEAFVNTPSGAFERYMKNGIPKRGSTAQVPSTECAS